MILPPFAIDSTNNQKIYAGSFYGGVYVSADGGSTWSTNSQTTNSIFQIIVDPDDTDEIYAAGENGFYISTDGGANWSPSGAISGSILDLAQSASSHDILYAMAGSTSNYELYKSADRGTSWSNLGHTNIDPQKIAVDPSDSDTIYLATSSSSAYKSTDGGVSISQANTGLPSNPTTIWRIQTDGSNLFAVTRSGLFKSSDGGINWQVLKSLSGITRGVFSESKRWEDLRT